MKDHEIILKMIEEVDPSDVERLNEIDARVKCYVLDWVVDHTIYTWDDKPLPFWQGPTVQNSLPKYTRSRDALKAIRPEGYFCIMRIFLDKNSCTLFKPNQVWEAITGKLPTEELAELHAVIQAIDYERKRKCINTQ